MANTTIFGALGLPDTDNSFLTVIGQSIIYDGTQQVLGDHNADLANSSQLFIERRTEDFKIRYKLEGTGRLQRKGRQARAAEVAASGSWDIGLPLEEFGAGFALDRVTFGYMTLQEYDRQLRTIMIQDRNTRRFEILKALFNNTSRTFVDENKGNITVVPLANNDTVKYPPVVGSEVTATANNYLGVASDISGAGAITDANNPIPTLVSTLEQHFGTPTTGSNIVVFINNAQTTGVLGLTNFDQVPNRFVTYGQNVSLVDNWPANVPGRVLGETDSALIVEWRWIPAGYMLALHLDAPKPLMERVDPAYTALGSGLQLVSEDPDEPFRHSEWSHRYGLGVGNRLNGAVVDLTAAGGANTYTIPTIYQ